MSFFDKPFDATAVEPQGAWKPIPDGEYLCLVKSAAEEPTRDRKGSMLHMELSVLDAGPAKGRVVHYRITLENKNAQAVEIGQRQLTAVSLAAGFKRLDRPQQLVGKTIKFKIAVVPRDDKPTEMTNDVRGVILPDAAPAAPAPGGSAADAGAPAVAKPPWA
jgi:hypothetical protein